MKDGCTTIDTPYWTDNGLTSWKTLSRDLVQPLPEQRGPRRSREGKGSGHPYHEKQNAQGEPLGRRWSGLRRIPRGHPEDFPGFALIILKHVQPMRQVEGRSPQAGATVQTPDQGWNPLQMQSLLRHAGDRLIVEDMEQHLFSAAVP